MQANDLVKEGLVNRDIGGAVVAGMGGSVLHAAAAALYEAGGKELLSDGTQTILRAAAMKASGGQIASAVLTAGGATKQLMPAVQTAAKRVVAFSARASTPLLRDGAKSLSRGGVKAGAAEAAKVAGRELLKGVGKTAAVGFAVDAVFGTIEAVRGVRAGELSKRQALVHVGKEAATGAVAAGLGAAACAGLVALTGPLGFGAILIVSGGASFGAKRALRRLLA